MSAPLPAFPAASRSVDFMRATSAFVREHGTGLSDLVDILADTNAIDALCDLAANLGAATRWYGARLAELRTKFAALA